jgi:RNA polymerase sigma-70 factor (ECF subfamily)
MLYEFDQQQLETFESPAAVSIAQIGDASEEDLMKRIQARDEEALEILIKRYNAMLRSIVGRMIANDQDVTDVIEDVFIGVWNQASNFDNSKGKPMGWIITMARRRAIDRVRRRQAYDRAEMRLRLSTDSGSSHLASDDVEEEANSSDMAELFKELISTLPEAQQQVVHLAFYQGLSQREISKKTGIPLGTVKTRIELGVKKLRAAVTAFGPHEKWFGKAE